MLGFQCFQQEIRYQGKRKAGLILGMNSNSVIFDQVLTPVVPCVLADMPWGWQHNKRTGHCAVKAMNKPCQSVALADGYQEEAQMNWKKKENDNLPAQAQLGMVVRQKHRKQIQKYKYKYKYKSLTGLQRWVRMVRWSWVSDWSVIWLPHRSPPLTTRSWNKSKCSVNLCSNLWLFLFWLRKGMVSLECYHHYPISRQFCKPLYMHWQICSYHKLFPILRWELTLYCPGPLPLYSSSQYPPAHKRILQNNKNQGLVPPNVKTREGTECSPISSCWAEI